MSESPWSSVDIKINLILLIILMTFSTVMLIIKSWLSWIFLGVYWICWGLYIIIGRYVTCRHCDFLGKACPSWCMGVIGNKLYKRSQKENFCQDGFLIHALFDISFLLISLVTPIIAYLFELFFMKLQLLDWILLIIYIILALSTLTVHNVTGCRKCPIKDCPLSGKK